MQKLRRGLGPGTEKYGHLFTTKYTKHPAHVHTISHSRCNVTRSAQEWQHRFCRVYRPYTQRKFISLDYVALFNYP